MQPEGQFTVVGEVEAIVAFEGGGEEGEESIEQVQTGGE